VWNFFQGAIMTENELAAIVVDTAFHIHCDLGPGLLEGAYEAVLAHELSVRGLKVERQKILPLVWKGLVVDDSYRPDLLVESKLVVELKSVEVLIPVHKKQLLTYLKVGRFKLGLLINFGAAMFKGGIERVINGSLDSA
jgi:GxxExxY protein